MKTILFQGDSITACHRDLNNPADLGQGYAGLVARALEKKYPGQFTFVNRGVSGDRITDLYQRRQADILDVKPDVISILVGVNDVWHEKTGGTGVDVETYLDTYHDLLTELRQALPNTKIMLMEPFVNEGSATEDDIEWFEGEMAMRSEAVQMLCAKHDVFFLSLQFDLYDLEEQKPAGHWTLDGIHPTLNFHQYMADKWVKAFEVHLNK